MNVNSGLKMKRIPIIYLAVLCLLISCRDEEVKNIKDLEENMMDLRIYQENLGDHIKQKRLEDADWLLEGMDSILLILNRRFPEHRKLSRSFSHFYNKEMKEPISGIREAIHNNDTAAALSGYRLLIKNCNSCHIDNDIDKTVKF